MNKTWAQFPAETRKQMLKQLTFKICLNGYCFVLWLRLIFTCETDQPWSTTSKLDRTRTYRKKCICQFYTFCATVTLNQHWGHWNQNKLVAKKSYIRVRTVFKNIQNSGKTDVSFHQARPVWDSCHFWSRSWKVWDKCHFYWSSWKVMPFYWGCWKVWTFYDNARWSTL